MTLFLMSQHKVVRAWRDVRHAEIHADEILVPFHVLPSLLVFR